MKIIRFIAAAAAGLFAGATLLLPNAQAQTPRPLDPADVAVLTGRPAGNLQTQASQQKNDSANAQTAPVRPPLDWRDVDILTGKAGREARSRTTYGQPYLYVDPYSQVAPYGRRMFTPIGRNASPFFSPFFFRSAGRGNRSFFGARPFASPFFFGRVSPRRFFFFF